MPPSRAIVIAVRRLGDRVHRRAEDGDAELEPAAEAGLHVDVLGEHLAVGGGEQDVVERQALAEFVVEHVTV